jgi:hypothetical protein
MPGSTSFHFGTVACVLTLVLAGCAPRVDLDLTATFQEAQQTFDQASSPGDFLKAAAMYQQILDSGVVSGAVLYNQGNAFVQAGRPGRAIAAYRQAERYRPRDPLLDANLRNALGAEDPVTRRRPIIEYLLFWQDWLSYPEKFGLVTVVAVVTFAVGVCVLFVDRRWVRNVALAGVALTLLLAFSAGYDWYRYDHLVHGVVTEDEVIARKGNASSYEPAFTEPLAEGTEFRLVDRRGDWLLARMPGGQEGWVPEDSVVLY